MQPLELHEIALRLGAALLLGTIVGFEREWYRHAAGMRTMILISMGSAGFLLLGSEIIASDTGDGSHVPEMSRVLSGLIGGIGFLGAGTIIRNRGTVHGLTTAATVFCVAAMGGACGLGHYRLAGVLAVFTLLTLTVLRMVETKFIVPAAPAARQRAHDASTTQTSDENDRV